jgi:hypothetical protein
VTAEFVMEKVIVPICVAAIGVLGGYRLASRIRRSQVQVEKRIGVIEKMAAALQEERDRRTRIRDWFTANYRGSTSQSEAIDDFCQKSDLHKETYDEIGELSEATARFWTLRREAEVYLDDLIVAEVEAYVVLTRVASLSDGGLGLIDTYHEEFLKKLLDKDNNGKLTEKYASAMQMLRNAMKVA